MRNKQANKRTVQETLAFQTNQRTNIARHSRVTNEQTREQMLCATCAQQTNKQDNKHYTQLARNKRTNKRTNITRDPRVTTNKRTNNARLLRNK